MSDFGVYIHIPFCDTKCNYCSFVTRAHREATAERYCRAVVSEIESEAPAEAGRDVADTLYFGGGTPSRVPAEHIARILTSCRRRFRLATGCEVTVEANPEDVTTEKAEAYVRLGVNRVSLGAESFDDGELLAIGRVHDADRIERAWETLRGAGFSNLNLDLMVGLPGQTPKSWNRSLERAISLAPDHISVYMLELEPRAPLLHLAARGRVRLPGDDSVCDWYLALAARAGEAGYRHYEISNFARPGLESRHNLRYWRRDAVLGFGVGSHSFDGMARYANVAGLEAYLRAVEEGRSAVEWRREIAPQEALEEKFYLGLRLDRGVDLDALAPRDAAAYGASLRELEDAGLIERERSCVRLTPRGRLLSNEVFQHFV